MPRSLPRRCCDKRSLVVKNSLALANEYLHPAFQVTHLGDGENRQNEHQSCLSARSRRSPVRRLTSRFRHRAACAQNAQADGIIVPLRNTSR